jgi:hypothetical protein
MAERAAKSQKMVEPHAKVNPCRCVSFLLLFTCVFEAIFNVKVNLGFHKYVDGGSILDIQVG